MELTADRLVAGGDALARDGSGRVVFVRGALPGERVLVELTSAKRDFATAAVTAVLDPSPDRVAPPCPHRREGCGGCPWMHLEPGAQLAAKVGIVRDSLRRIARLGADATDELVVAGGSVSPTGYRTTIRVVGGPGGAVGFRERAGDAVVAVEDCLVAHPALSALLPDLRVAAGVELTLRTSVTTGALTARWNRRGADAVTGLPRDARVGDRAYLVETVSGRPLRISAASFFQSGREAAELLVDAVGRAAPELVGARHAVDAYGGVGLFAATVMAGADHVTLVESTRWGCADAGHNLAGRSATIVRGEVGRWSAGERPVDVVVADPARPGLGVPGTTALAGAHPAPIVLVSCDPASLARDTALLAGRGYRPERVEVLDLYPRTPHVETVTRFRAVGV